MRFFILTLFLLFSSLSWSNEISVGGVNLTIPQPEGYSPVTSEMEALYEWQKLFILPMNKEFTAFIPDDQVGIALKNEIPHFLRHFSVQTSKKLINVTVTNSAFAAFKKAIKSENIKPNKKFETQLSESMKTINEKTKEQYGVDPAFSVSQIILMPVHEETDRTISYSTLVKYNMKDKKGNPLPYFGIVTTTCVHVKGKVLFLCAYSEKSDLEWSRQASRKWVNSVINANPSDILTGIKETVPFRISITKWTQRIFKGALKGAFVALLITLFYLVIVFLGWVKRRKR